MEETNQIKKSYYEHLIKNKRSTLTATIVSFLLGSTMGAVFTNLLDNLIGKQNFILFTLITVLFIVLVYNITVKLLILSEIENSKNENIRKKIN
jgi:hypothetical protein